MSGHELPNPTRVEAIVEDPRIRSRVEAAISARFPPRKELMTQNLTEDMVEIVKKIRTRSHGSWGNINVREMLTTMEEEAREKDHVCDKPTETPHDIKVMLGKLSAAHIPVSPMLGDSLIRVLEFTVDMMNYNADSLDALRKLKTTRKQARNKMSSRFAIQHR